MGFVMPGMTSSIVLDPGIAGSLNDLAGWLAPFIFVILVALSFYY